MSLIYMRAEDIASVDEEGRTLFLTTARPGEGWRPLSASITEEYLHAYARAQVEAARRIWQSVKQAPCLGEPHWEWVSYPGVIRPHWEPR